MTVVWCLVLELVDDLSLILLLGVAASLVLVLVDDPGLVLVLLSDCLVASLG